MKKHNKLMALLLAVAMVLPGVVQAAPKNEGVQLSKELDLIRISGDSRVGTALEASKEAYPNTAETVVIAGSGSEVDALAGTLLASDKDAPLLLSGKKELRKDVLAKIKDLDAKKAYILGGEKAVPQKVVRQLKDLDLEVDRVGGKNRNETAVKVAELVKGDSIDKIFLASGADSNLSDALAIGPVSAIDKTPVFLTNVKQIPNTTMDAIKKLGVKKVVIIGGKKAVTRNVEKELGNKFQNRISGSNRYNTAIAIAKKYFTDPKKVVIANGYKIADALVGGYLGAMNNAPILLVNIDLISSNTVSFLKNNTDLAYVLGGVKVVSKNTYNAIKQLIPYSKDSSDLPNRTLKYLETGRDVENVQTALKKLGYNVSVDGSYGPSTKAAILAFQKKYSSLVNNGIYGPNTRAKMIEALKSINNDKPNNTKIETRGLVFTIGKASDQVKLLKDFFRARGEKNIPQDYNYDKRTKDLVRAYQKLRGLKVDGIAGPGTMARINKEIKDTNLKIGLVTPRISNKGNMIMINRSSNTLYFIRNGVIQNSYPVATGRARSSLTPDGRFTIVVKYKNPSWGGAGMYPPIAGGAPNNPLGTRWLGISLRGGGVYGVHGNADPSSIGEFVSLGCVRMFNKDVEALYNKVNVKTPIWIGSEGLLENYGVKFQ